MVNQKTGKLIQQKPVTSTFDFDTVKSVVDQFVKNYDSGLEARALNHIVENWDSIPKRIRDLKKQGSTKAKKASKAVDALANQTLAAQPAEIKRSDRDYSYEALTNKPDMVVTEVGGNVPKNRADIIAMAKKNATSVGRFDPKTGSVSVHVKDIGTDVVLGTNGLKHGLEGRRTENAIVTLKAGEILQNSIRINELTPKKEEADGSYVLIGAARGSNGDLYIVRSVVNTFKHELMSMDVLYAINAKKENRLRSMRPGFQGPVTDSTISIAELLDHVNQYFPDILPEEVLKHYGYDARPEGKLGEDALYSDRDSDGNQLSKEQQAFFKHSKVRDNDGNLKVVYHGTSKGGYTVFDPWGKGKYGLFGVGIYFTDSKNIAESYTKKGKGTSPQIYEAYLNITNPINMDAQADSIAWKKRFPDATFPESGTNEDFYRAMEEYFEDEGYVRWEAEESAMYALDDMGYDGITHIGGGRVNPDGERHQVYIAFTPEQVKNTSNINPTDNPDIRYSDRDAESVSNRSLLANAFEGVAQNDIERQKIQEYKGKISLVEAEERKLSELNAQIKDLSFAKGPRDKGKLSTLRDEASKTANRINIYDKQLLRLEASKPLQNVLEREKQKAYRRAEQKGKEALEAYRLTEEVKLSEILRDYRETRAALRQQKSDTAVMEREFIRIAKAFEKLDAKSTAKFGKDASTINDLKVALKDETKKHSEDQKVWEAEFNRLLREYEAAGQNIDKLQAKIERQRQVAETRADNRKRSAVREKIKAFKSRLERSLLNPTDKRYVPVDLIKAMVEVCGLIDTDTELYHADGSINKAQEKRNLTKEKLQNLKDEYEKLKTHSDPIYAGEFDEMVYAYLTDLRDNYGGKNLKDMSLDELTEMYESLRGIEETLQDARKLIGWGDMDDVYEAGDAIVAEQSEITQSRKGGKRNAAQIARDKSLNLSLSPVRNVERMSGYNQDSYLLKLFKKFEQGIRKKNKFVMEAYKNFESLTSDKEYDDAIYKEVSGKKYEDVNGRKFGVSKMQMMQTILSYEREAANSMHHIEGSGFSFADLDMLRKGRFKDAISEEYSHRVPAAVNLVAEFTEALKNDKWCQDYMETARKFFNGIAKDVINETSIALKHRIIAKDKSYIPFEVDKNFVVREISAEDEIQQTINAYGMLKDTKKDASQPLIITGLNNILDRHIDQVGNVYGLAIEVRNFDKVWNLKSLDVKGNEFTVKAAIQRNWGIEGTDHITQAVQDIQAPRHSKQSALYKKIKSTKRYTLRCPPPKGQVSRVTCSMR